MTFTIVQNDTAPTLVSTLREDEVPIDLSTASNITFYMENKYEEVVIIDDISGDVGVIDATGGEVEYIFTNDQTSDIGTYQAEWQVEYSDGTIETFPSIGKITVEITEEIQ